MHGTEYKITCGTCLSVSLRGRAGCWGRISRKRLEVHVDANIYIYYIEYNSYTPFGTGSVTIPTNHQQEMTYGESNGPVIDDLM